jgi:hypothetical protein
MGRVTLANMPDLYIQSQLGKRLGAPKNIGI